MANYNFHERLSKLHTKAAVADRRLWCVTGALLSVLGAIRLRLGFQRAVWSLTAGLVVLILSLIAPRVLSLLTRLILRWSSWFGRVLTTIVMVFLFFFCFVPVGWLLRILRVPLLDLGYDSDAESYWIVRTVSEKCDMRQLF
jgi:hypothetical protein